MATLTCDGKITSGGSRRANGARRPSAINYPAWQPGVQLETFNLKPLLDVVLAAAVAVGE